MKKYGRGEDFFIIIILSEILRPVVPAPGDRWWWLWSNWWNEDLQGKPKYSEKICPSATLSITNPTWSNPGSRGEDLDPLILDLGTRWRWVVSFTPRPFTPGKRDLGTHWIGGSVGPRAVWTLWRSKKPLAPTWNWTPVFQPVACRYVGR
jgi:hypothetical protein